MCGCVEEQEEHLSGYLNLQDLQEPRCREGKWGRFEKFVELGLDGGDEGDEEE